MAAYQEGRFYEAEFPEVEEIVVVQVKRIVDMGAYVTLLEYDGKEGMMLLSELSKRRIRSVSKLLKVGRTEVCLVLRVDQEKGYVDLSKRRVAPEDATKKEETFAKGKAVHGIMRHVASICEVDVTTLCEKVAWPMYKKYGCAYEAFRKHVNGEINLWEVLDFSGEGDDDLSPKAEKLKEMIEVDLRRKLIQQMMRLRAKVEVSCYEYEGIDAIKKALLEGTKADRDDIEVKIKLIAHPLFVVSCMCRDKQLGTAIITESMDLIKKSIEDSKGVFAVRAAPEVVGQDEPDHVDDKSSDSGSESGDSTESEQDEGMGNLVDAEALKKLEEDAKNDKDGEED